MINGTKVAYQLTFGALFILVLYWVHIISFAQGFNTSTDEMYDRIASQTRQHVYDSSGKQIFFNFSYLNFDMFPNEYDTYYRFWQQMENTRRMKR